MANRCSREGELMESQVGRESGPDDIAPEIVIETKGGLKQGARVSVSLMFDHVFPDTVLRLHCTGYVASVQEHGGDTRTTVAITSYRFEPSDRPAAPE